MQGLAVQSLSSAVSSTSPLQAPVHQKQVLLILQQRKNLQCDFTSPLACKQSISVTLCDGKAKQPSVEFRMFAPSEILAH